MRELGNLYVFKRQDEYYTPSILVKPLLKYLKPNSVIWCPFDTKDSEYVRVFQKAGHKVIYSSILMGEDYDFFSLVPPQGIDYIISNPPFSMKLDVLKRLYDFKIPFAMLITTACLNYMNICDFFTSHPLQLLLFNKRFGLDGGPSTFSLSYFCNNFLPKDLIFENLDYNRKTFVPSKMYEQHKDLLKIEYKFE